MKKRVYLLVLPYFDARTRTYAKCLESSFRMWFYLMNCQLVGQLSVAMGFHLASPLVVYLEAWIKYSQVSNTTTSTSRSKSSQFPVSVYSLGRVVINVFLDGLISGHPVYLGDGYDLCCVVEFFGFLGRFDRQSDVKYELNRQECDRDDQFILSGLQLLTLLHSVSSPALSVPQMFSGCRCTVLLGSWILDVV